MIRCQFNSAAGQVVVTIATGETDHDVEIYGIAPIAYKFDLTPGQAQIEALFAMYQGTTIDIDRYDTIGRDMYDLLRTAAPTTVQVQVTTFEREVYDFNFKFELGDISTDEESNRVKIRLKAAFNEGLTAGEVFDALTGQLQFTRNATISQFGTAQQTQLQPYTAASVSDWIQAALKQLFADQNTIVRAGLSDLGSGYTPELFGPAPLQGQRGFMMVNFPDLFFGATGEGRTVLNGTGRVTTSIEGEDFQNGAEVYIVRITGVGTSFLSEVAVGDEIQAVFYMGQVIARDSDTVMYTLLTKYLYTAVTDRPFRVYSTPRPRQIPALDVLKSLAGSEGSFFGSGFSRNFYINRLRRTVEDRVYLPWASVENCKPVYQNAYLGPSFVANLVDGRKRGSEEYGAWPAPVSTTNRRLPNLLPTKATVPGNRNADKSLQVSLAPGYPFLAKGLRSAEQVQGDFTGDETDDLLEQALVQVGVQSHYKALTGAGDQLMIEFTCQGAFSLKPWQTFVFIDPPERYANKEFRITEIAYDIVSDVFTARAYQVDTVDPVTVPDRITNLGLDFQFGNKILPPGLIAPVNNVLADGLRMIATFVTSAPVGGTIIEVPILRPEGDTTVVPQTYKITLVNPALMSQRIELEVDVTFEATDTAIKVFPYEYIGTFPAGSFVYISNRSVMTGILTGEFGIDLFSKTFGVGVLTQPVSGLVTEIPAYMVVSVAAGRSLYIIDILRNVSVNIQTTDAAVSGPGMIAIEEQLINMPAGALIWLDGAQIQAFFNMDPGHVQLGVIRERKANAIGQLVDGISTISPITQLDVMATKPGLIAGGTPLRVTNYDGSGDTFVANGDTEIVGTSGAISIVAKTPIVGLYAGATVTEPSGNASSRISIASQQISILSSLVTENTTALALLETRVSDTEASVIAQALLIDDFATGLAALELSTNNSIDGINATAVLKASVDGNAITKLAYVAVNASVGSGSSIFLRANDVITDGQATFFNSLYSGGVESATGAQDKADAARAAAEAYGASAAAAAQNAAISQSRNNVAAQLGYVNYADMVAEAVAGRSILNGGYFRTSLIQVDSLFAINASITAELLLAAGGRFTNTNDDFRVSSSGVRIRAGIAGNVTAKQYSIIGFYSGNPDYKIGYIEGLVNSGGTLGQVRHFAQTNMIMGTSYNSNALQIERRLTVEGSYVDVVYVNNSVRLYARALRFDGSNEVIDSTTFYDFSYMPRRAMDKRYLSAIPIETPQSFSNQIEVNTSGIIAWRNNTGPRIYDGSPGVYYVQLRYTAGGSNNRDLNIPVLEGARTVALINQDQVFTNGIHRFTNLSLNIGNSVDDRVRLTYSGTGVKDIDLNDVLLGQMFQLGDVKTANDYLQIEIADKRWTIHAHRENI